MRAGVPRARIAARFRPGVGGLRDRARRTPTRTACRTPRPWSTAARAAVRRRQLRHLAGLFRLRVRARGGDRVHAGERAAFRAAVHRRSVFEDPRPAGLGHRAAVRRRGDGDWLAPDPVYRCRPAIFGSDGSMGHSIAVPAPGKPLAMLGSNVFKFSMTVVPEQVQAYLARERLSVLRRHRPGPAAPGQPVHRRQPRPQARAAPGQGAVRSGATGQHRVLDAAADAGTAAGRAPGRILLCGFGVGLSGPRWR